MSSTEFKSEEDGATAGLASPKELTSPSPVTVKSALSSAASLTVLEHECDYKLSDLEEIGNGSYKTVFVTKDYSKVVLISATFELLMDEELFDLDRQKERLLAANPLLSEDQIKKVTVLGEDGHVYDALEVPYLGCMQASDLQISVAVIDACKHGEVVVVDACGIKNCLTSGDKVYIVDVDHALKRGSFLSEKLWADLKEKYISEFFPSCERAGKKVSARTIKLLKCLQEQDITGESLKALPTETLVELIKTHSLEELKTFFSVLPVSFVRALIGCGYSAELFEISAAFQHIGLNRVQLGENVMQYLEAAKIYANNKSRAKSIKPLFNAWHALSELPQGFDFHREFIEQKADAFEKLFYLNVLQALGKKDQPLAFYLLKIGLDAARGMTTKPAKILAVDAAFEELDKGDADFAAIVRDVQAKLIIHGTWIKRKAASRVKHPKSYRASSLFFEKVLALSNREAGAGAGREVSL